jgi:flagellar biosynthesis GTPase FlhF
LDPSVLGESGRRLVADATRPALHFRAPDALDAALAAATSNAPGSMLGASTSASIVPMRSSGAVLSRSSADVRAFPRPGGVAASSSARPAMFAPKRQHPSLASAVASRAPVAPKHKVMMISNDELKTLVASPDKELAREEKQAQKQAERTQKIKEREEKRQRRDEEKLEQKQARDAVRLLEKASKVTASKKRKQPHALAGGMGDLLAAGQQDSEDEDDENDDDDDDDGAGAIDADVDNGGAAAAAAATTDTYLGELESGAKAVNSFMAFTNNASVSAPQFPSATPGAALTRADELSKMLESVLTNKPAQTAPAQQPAAQSAAAALAGLTPAFPTWPTQPPQQQAPADSQLQTILASVFEDADMTLVSATQHQRIRQFIGGNRTNPDPSSPVHSIVLRKSIKDDHEVTLLVELNYENATWRKVSRRKRLAAPPPTPMA